MGYLENFARNARLFLLNDFHMKSGIKFLSEEFYRSIREGGPVPIPYREILLTSRIMDEIFSQVYGNTKRARREGFTRSAASRKPEGVESASRSS